jgi:predicted nucleotidyltransferase component of viral defense system
MRKSNPTNLPASVHQRLLTWSVANHEDMNLVMTRYALERFLFRLAQSPFGQQFVLKGAMLFTVWSPHSHRATRDLDLLAYVDDSDERLAEVFQTICRTDVPADGLVFDADRVQVSAIREDQEYQGKRVEMTARLGRSRVKVQVDVGFGDVITPAPQVIEYPTLLDLPAPRIRAYSRESVVAEKLNAVVSIGVQNSRMKDFYDLVALAGAFPFEGAVLTQAVKATFSRRRTQVPDPVPAGLSEEFGSMPDKRMQWAAFLERGRLPVPTGEFSEVVQKVREFLWPVLQAVAQDQKFDRGWKAGGPWAKEPRT